MLTVQKPTTACVKNHVQQHQKVNYDNTFSNKLTAGMHMDDKSCTCKSDHRSACSRNRNKLSFVATLTSCKWRWICSNRAAFTPEPLLWNKHPFDQVEPLRCHQQTPKTRITACRGNSGPGQVGRGGQVWDVWCVQTTQSRCARASRRWSFLL